jgi:acetyl esterase
VRIVRPKHLIGRLPVVIYFHGGGWVLGDKETHDRLIREIANGAKAAVVFIDYSLAPEVQYPVAIEEAYAATKWLAENGKSINLDPSRLAVAGDSVGGNMATAVTLLAKERGGPKIGFQVLFYPVTDASFDTPSYHQFAEGYFLTREAMKWFWNHYAPDLASRNQPMAAPLRASTEQLRGLPPALVITGECDVLRDEGEAYARKLDDAGVTVTMTRYPGIIHDFVMLNAITDTAATRDAIAQANKSLRKVFAH